MPRCVWCILLTCAFITLHTHTTPHHTTLHSVQKTAIATSHRTAGAHLPKADEDMTINTQTALREMEAIFGMDDACVCDGSEEGVVGESAVVVPRESIKPKAKSVGVAPHPVCMCGVVW